MADLALTCLSLPSVSLLFPGEWDQCVSEQKTGAASVVYGGYHGDLLPAVLAAIWYHGFAGHLRTTGPGHTRGKHHSLGPGQDEHCHQPSHLCLYE